ncbi:STAS domain-containing protein [Streptomyces sp. B1866]|uniref:STAS domain-containing protein n=1 Tax=Streptomyces sp. B1866 TaxID=3075431 RepID=UPI0028904B11|nr:STAS domain-containing protein [Streptomyces sp. B1866]MDT3397388.1 STAS domain-containing protein [Streptomyces sp. B1866]
MTPVEGLHTSVFLTEDRAIVCVAGEVDFATAPGLRQALQAAVAGGRPLVEVDFAGVSFCDCSGVNALLGAWQRARADGVAFRVVGVQAAIVTRVFRLLDVERVLGLRPAR